MKFRGLTSRGVIKGTRTPISSLTVTDDESGKSVKLGPGFLQWERREAPAREAKAALKGVKGGNCNITACQSSGAYFWNRVMDRYYCHYCATDMHRFAARVGEETLYPNYDQELLEYRRDADAKREAFLNKQVRSASDL